MALTMAWYKVEVVNMEVVNDPSPLNCSMSNELSSRLSLRQVLPLRVLVIGSDVVVALSAVRRTIFSHGRPRLIPISSSLPDYTVLADRCRTTCRHHYLVVQLQIVLYSPKQQRASQKHH